MAVLSLQYIAIDLLQQSTLVDDTDPGGQLPDLTQYVAGNDFPLFGQIPEKLTNLLVPLGVQTVVDSSNTVTLFLWAHIHITSGVYRRRFS